MPAENKKKHATHHTPTETRDALVIGAGVAGLYQLHLLREQGMDVLAVDTATDVGGTWYWNRYPGARFDSEAFIYQYLFSETLYKNWSWSERFPAQPEIERWMHYVADTLDLRKDIRFSTTVEKAVWDGEKNRWFVSTSQGDLIETQFLVTCCGMLSAPMQDLFPGQDTFKGEIFHTARWPKEPVDFNGKRVGVVGIGATGIQVIQTIAPDVGDLKVFVRTPQYTLPMRNKKFSAEDVAEYKSKFDEIKQFIPTTFTGHNYNFLHVWDETSPEKRLEVLEDQHEDGSLKLCIAAFGEMYSEQGPSDEISEFVRGKMRARLRDEKLCDLLIPKDYGFGTHRVPLETNFLEAFLRPNVEGVNVRDNPIARVTPSGIELADGTHYDLDILVLATGFDAATGALTRIDIRGRDDRSLKDEWSQDIRSTMGLQIHGYPNLFTTAAPLAPSAALCNMPTCLQQQAEWISDCIRYLRMNDKSVIEPTSETEEAWVQHHEETVNETLIPTTNSWWLGSNVPGKPRRVLSYTGGVGVYRDKCAEVAQSEYAGFNLN